jgi:hypothetical protein
MMKVFSAVMLSILLSSLIVVGARVAGPIVAVRQASESPVANGDGGTKASSVNTLESPLNQTYKGANDNGGVTSAGNAGVMWIEPSRVSLPKNLAAVGYRFNVTIWLNMTQNIYGYQIALLYNRTQLKCDRVGFTDGRTSVYFEGHFSAENMVIDGSLGNGSIEAWEGCMGSDYVSGPHVASLIWAEFEVLTVPSSNMSFTSKFDISTEYGTGSKAMTWVAASDASTLLPFALHDGHYEILSTSDLSVSVDPAVVTMYAGQSQLFASNVTGGTPPYTFQWCNDYGAALDGTGSTWTFTPDTPGSHQVYLEVTDSSNTLVTSNFVSVDAASPGPYSVTINASCDTDRADINVPIMMDGSSTGLDTPQTFTGLTGTHSFTVPSLDSNGHSFRLWDRGSASTTIVLSNGGAYTARYGGDQWPADAMWVEPPNVSLTGDSAAVGYRFNVTVWLNMTQNIYAYSIGLFYNRTQLKCDRVGFTDGGTNEYFTGHYSTAMISIDGGMGNGSLMAFEGCVSSDYVSGPHVASLIWAEFEVLTVPSSNMSFTSKFDISTEYTGFFDARTHTYETETWVVAPCGEFLQLTPHDGYYQFS